MQSLGFALMLGLGILPTLTRADTVVLGSDYLHTEAGSYFYFGSSIGTVDFKSNPIGPGNTDTIVQRQADATIGGAAIPIQLTQLSMESVAPVVVGAVSYNVFVTLDPANLSNDTGMMTISGTAAGGTFSSTLNVYFQAQFEPVGGGVGSTYYGMETFNASGSWTSTPPPGAVLVSGPVGDQNANMHTGLAKGQVDFYTVGQTIHIPPGGGAEHIVDGASVPEPSTWIMLLTAGGLLPIYTKWGRRRA
ncbi:MAG: PEP-CTERM sorting domain-containing protein [Isosphaeraceae bacterium]